MVGAAYDIQYYRSIVKMGHIISAFVKELPVTYIFGGIFLPVALLLLGLISYLRIKLEEVNVELARASERKNVLRDYCLQYSQLKASENYHLKKTC